MFTNRIVAALGIGVSLVAGAFAQSPLDVMPPLQPNPYVPFPHVVTPSFDEARNGYGIAQRLTRADGLQGRVLWIDATANLERINTVEKIDALVKKIRETGFNTIVLDIKPIVGEVLYPSQIAPKMTEWKGRTLPKEFDPLSVMLAKARENKLSLFVSMNAFSEGHSHFPERGPGAKRPDWQTVLCEPELRIRVDGEEESAYLLSDRVNQPPRQLDDLALYSDASKLPKLADGAVIAVVDSSYKVLAQFKAANFNPAVLQLPPGSNLIVGFSSAAGLFVEEKLKPNVVVEMLVRPAFVPMGKRTDRQIPLMMNPLYPAVRHRLRNLLIEVAHNYDVDGILFDDRLRFASINADMSDTTRVEFEKWMQKSVDWPRDIFRWEVAWPTLQRRVIPGPLYDAWLTFRAMTLRNWLAETVKTVKTERPSMQVGTYVGSWYPDYPEVGGNWAADDLQVGLRFHTDSFRRTGWANLVDLIITGCYYPVASMRDAAEQGISVGESVEAAGQFSNRAVNDQSLVYAGISLDKFKGRDKNDLRKVLQAACATTQGVMVFDLSHDMELFWDTFADVFRIPATAPHAVPGFVAKVRDERLKQKVNGLPEPPVILYKGASGTGF